LFDLRKGTNHRRTFFEIIQNGGVYQDGGFQQSHLKKIPKINDKTFFHSFNGFFFRKNQTLIKTNNYGDKIQNGGQKSKWRQMVDTYLMIQNGVKIQNGAKIIKTNFCCQMANFHRISNVSTFCSSY
jgi:hypothetical protein